jgi:hypothetical protein
MSKCTRLRGWRTAQGCCSGRCSCHQRSDRCLIAVADMRGYARSHAVCAKL